jgi:hypothetical protein
MPSGDAVVTASTARVSVFGLLAFALVICGCRTDRTMTVSAVRPSDAAGAYLTGFGLSSEKLWVVPDNDLKRIGTEIRRHIKELNRGVGGALISTIAANLDNYFAECLGFVVRGERQVFCNVIRLPTNEISPRSEEFTALFDGASDALKVILAPTLEVIDLERQDRRTGP